MRADPYRGVNANMHTVEALLAAHDVTGDEVHLQRALSIVSHVVHEFARGNGYRLPEHYDEQWRPVLDYNLDQPGDRFRPYGVTIGHLMEWARLALHVRTALTREAVEPPAWLLDDARALFDRAVEDGWQQADAERDQTEGFVYTTDFDANPVVADRLHWVVTEAIATAWTLALLADRRRRRRHTGSGSTAGSSTPASTSSTTSTDPGGTSWTRRTVRPATSGRASRTSTTPTRRCSCRGSARSRRSSTGPSGWRPETRLSISGGPRGTV